MEQSNKRCYHAGVRPPEADIREAVHLYEQEGWTLLELGKNFIVPRVQFIVGLISLQKI
ncbi:MAG: hypothetical protein HDS21_00275 [Bacteroides sp.]|nr:hypothetical protein [Bacteroides sp.]